MVHLMAVCLVRQGVAAEVGSAYSPDFFCDRLYT